MILVPAEAGKSTKNAAGDNPLTNFCLGVIVNEEEKGKNSGDGLSSKCGENGDIRCVSAVLSAFAIGRGQEIAGFSRYLWEIKGTSGNYILYTCRCKDLWISCGFLLVGALFSHALCRNGQFLANFDVFLGVRFFLLCVVFLPTLAEINNSHILIYHLIFIA